MISNAGLDMKEAFESTSLFIYKLRLRSAKGLYLFNDGLLKLAFYPHYYHDYILSDSCIIQMICRVKTLWNSLKINYLFSNMIKKTKQPYTIFA